MAKTKKKPARSAAKFDDRISNAQLKRRVTELEQEVASLRAHVEDVALAVGDAQPKLQRAKLPDALTADELTWRSGGGEFAVSEMTDEHLGNALRWLVANFRPRNEADTQWRASWYAVLKLEAANRLLSKLADGLEALP